MNDPFFTLYNIIENSCLDKIKIARFIDLGNNNPISIQKLDSNYHSFEEFVQRHSEKYLIFHDQEPIDFSNQLEEWNNFKFRFNKLHSNHILSNSELNSKEKDKLLSFLGYKDFYWFSNGFLSLEWYRFYRYATYLENNFEPKFHFSCYNRLIHKRLHRPIISGALLTHAKNKIILSCEKQDLYSNTDIRNTTDYKNLDDVYKNYVDQLFSITDEVKINTKNYKGENRSFSIEVEDFINSFCHIITERIFFEDRIHLTEKSFRPIVCCRPFILVSSPKSLQYLKNYGFRTFDKFWSEDYDTECNHSKRLDKIIELIIDISKLSINELHNMLAEMKETLIFNRNHFYNDFSNIITKELYNNLENCIKITSQQKGYYYQIFEQLNDLQKFKIINSPEVAALEDCPSFDPLKFLKISSAEQNDVLEKNLKYFASFYKAINYNNSNNL